MPAPAPSQGLCGISSRGKVIELRLVGLSLSSFPFLCLAAPLIDYSTVQLLLLELNALRFKPREQRKGTVILSARTHI